MLREDASPKAYTKHVSMHGQNAVFVIYSQVPNYSAAVVININMGNQECKGKQPSNIRDTSTQVAAHYGECLKYLAKLLDLLFVLGGGTWSREFRSLLTESLLSLLSEARREHSRDLLAAACTSSSSLPSLTGAAGLRKMGV